MKHLAIFFHAFAVLLTGFAMSAQLSSPEAATVSIPAKKGESGKWKPDYYRAVVIYNAEKPAESDEGVNAIQSKIGDKIKSPNLMLRKIDMTDKANIDEKSAETLKLLEPELPFTMIYFPENSDVENPLWAGHMTLEDVAAISDSPARREIIRRLLKGESVVWLLIESGVDYKDYRILKLLSEEIKNIGANPPGVGTPVPPESEVKKEEVKPANPVKMSIMRISREDASEKILLNMLNGIEAEVMNISNEPVLVPVYAGGRILKFFSDEEINSENIRKTIELLSGEVVYGAKTPDSGTVLLLSVNWNGVASGKLSVDKEFPPLKTYSDKFSLEDVFPDENQPVSDSALTPASSDRATVSKPPVSMKIINFILVAIIGILILLFFAVVLRARK